MRERRGDKKEGRREREGNKERDREREKVGGQKVKGKYARASK